MIHADGFGELRPAERPACPLAQWLTRGRSFRPANDGCSRSSQNLRGRLMGDTWRELRYDQPRSIQLLTHCSHVFPLGSVGGIVKQFGQFAVLRGRNVSQIRRDLEQLQRRHAIQRRGQIAKVLRPTCTTGASASKECQGRTKKQREPQRTERRPCPSPRDKPS